MYNLRLKPMVSGYPHIRKPPYPCLLQIFADLCDWHWDPASAYPWIPLESSPGAIPLSFWRWSHTSHVIRTENCHGRTVEQQGFKLQQSQCTSAYFCNAFCIHLYTCIYIFQIFQKVRTDYFGLWHEICSGHPASLIFAKSEPPVLGAVLGFFRWHLMARYELAYQFKNGVIIPGELMQP